jgi:hypothetical protein
MALLIPHKIFRSWVLHGFIKKTVTIYSVIDKCYWVWISPNSERCSSETQNPRITQKCTVCFWKYTLFLNLRSVGLVRDYKKKYVNHLRVFVFRTPYVTVVWESSRVFFAVYYLKSIIKYIKNIYFCTRFPNFWNVENGQNVFSRNLKLKIHTKFPR